eukprot:2931270-Prymnesium_polylepis.1
MPAAVQPRGQSNACSEPPRHAHDWAAAGPTADPGAHLPGAAEHIDEDLPGFSARRSSTTRARRGATCTPT